MANLFLNSKKPTKFALYSLSILIGTLTVLVNSIHIGVALPREEVERIAHQSTARIKGQGRFLETFGSAVFIARTGNTYYALTNAHVVSGKGSYILIAGDRQEYPLKIDQIQQLPPVDLAIIRFTSDHNYPLIQLGDSKSLQIGQSIYGCGWVGGILLYCSQGQLIATNIKLSEGLDLAYSDLGRKGMSGGPLLDEEGHLIGIVSAQGTSTTPEHSFITVGLGISVNTFMRIATEAGLALGLTENLELAPSTSSGFGQTKN